jgi:chromosome segregation ATPase
MSNLKMLISDKEVGTYKTIVEPGMYSNYRKQKMIHSAKIIETIPVTVSTTFELNKKEDLQIPEAEIQRFAAEKFANQFLKNMAHTVTDKGDYLEHKYTVIMLEEAEFDSTLTRLKQEIYEENKSNLNALSNKNIKLNNTNKEITKQYEELKEQIEYKNMEALTAQNKVKELEETIREERQSAEDTLKVFEVKIKQLEENNKKLSSIKDKYEKEGFFTKLFRRNKYED